MIAHGLRDVNPPMSDRHRRDTPARVCVAGVLPDRRHALVRSRNSESVFTEYAAVRLGGALTA